MSSPLLEQGDHSEGMYLNAKNDQTFESDSLVKVMTIIFGMVFLVSPINLLVFGMVILFLEKDKYPQVRERAILFLKLNIAVAVLALISMFTYFAIVGVPEANKN